MNRFVRIALFSGLAISLYASLSSTPMAAGQAPGIAETAGATHFRGTVTYVSKTSGVFIQQDDSGTYLPDADSSGIAVGDVVEVSGLHFRDGLRKAQITKVDSGAPIEPASLRYADATSGEYRNRLVSLTGRLVSQYRDGDTDVILCRVDDHVVAGYLNDAHDSRSIANGSTVRLTGVLIDAANDPADDPARLSIALRSAGDLQVDSVPSWFTLEHLEEMLVSLIALCGAIVMLRALRKRQQGPKVMDPERVKEIACERTRILDLIGPTHSLDEVLTEICTSIRQLLPGYECGYELTLDGQPRGVDACETNARPSRQCFDYPLVDSEQKTVGKIVVKSAKAKATAAERQEVLAVIAEMAGLAMKQALLFRGLLHRSNHDPLTSLPNRRYCDTRMALEIQEAEANGGRLALIYIDVNRFKQVNDTYGHRVGDLYLKAISERLSSQIRSIDTLARIGGDEFIVVAPYAELGDRSYALTSRLQECFDYPFDLEGTRIDGSASFGVAVYPEHGTTVEALTRHADQEMYAAKQDDGTRSNDLAIISSDELETALSQNRFRLAYQPQFSASGRMTGLEVLIRLDDPVLGTITPDAFITVAERHSVIVKIGAWVLRTALEDAMRWELDRGEPVIVAVNVAVRQLEEPDYAHSVLKCLEETGFPADRLELELVERSLMSGGVKTVHQLQQLRAAGVRIALDDFGTGQSCLSLLHQFPVDTIKLDRSFIYAMTNEPNVVPIIRAIVGMAHSLGKRVVAESIENVGPVAELLEMGEMDFQGHLLSRPIPADHVHTFIQTMRSGIVMPEAFRLASRGPHQRVEEPEIPALPDPLQMVYRPSHA